MHKLVHVIWVRARGNESETPKNKSKNIDWMREKMQEKSFVSPVEEVDQQAENE